LLASGTNGVQTPEQHFVKNTANNSAFCRRAIDAHIARQIDIGARPAAWLD
jgi:hypothetical protein